MGADEAERRRREFAARAPELRAAAVEELSRLLARVPDLSADEAAVMGHLCARAGYALDGWLHVPEFAALWGGAGDSYFPAVPIPVERARAAAHFLRRRGVLRLEGEGVVVDVEALRALAVDVPAKRRSPAAAAPAVAPRRVSGRRVIVYVAASVDGYIAKPDGGLGWLSVVETPAEDYGYAEFIKTVDVVLMGRKTYDKVKTLGVEAPHVGRRLLVLSRTRKGASTSMEYVRGDLAKLVARLQAEGGKDIFCDGGGETIHALLKKDLVDVLVVSLVPILLGEGIPLFKKGRPELKLKLASARNYPTGLVQLRYERA